MEEKGCNGREEGMQWKKRDVMGEKKACSGREGM